MSAKARGNMEIKKSQRIQSGRVNIAFNNKIERRFGTFKIQKNGNKYIHTVNHAPNESLQYIALLIKNDLCVDLKIGDVVLVEVIDHSETNSFGTKVILEPIRIFSVGSKGTDDFENLEYSKLLMEISLDYISRGWYSGFILETTAQMCLTDHYKDKHLEFYYMLQEARIRNALKKYTAQQKKRLHELPSLPDLMNYIYSLYQESTSKGYTPSKQLKNNIDSFLKKYNSFKRSLKRIEKKQKLQPKFEYIDHSEQGRINSIEAFTSNVEHRRLLMKNLMNGCLLYMQDDIILMTAAIKMNGVSSMGKKFFDIEKYKFFLRTFTKGSNNKVFPVFTADECQYIVNCFFSLGILQQKNGRLNIRYPDIKEIKNIRNITLQ